MEYREREHAIEFAKWIFNNCDTKEVLEDNSLYTYEVVYTYDGEYHSIEELHELYLKELNDI